MLEFILHSIGFFIIWFLIVRDNKFNIISKKGFYIYLVFILAEILIQIKI